MTWGCRAVEDHEPDVRYAGHYKFDLLITMCERVWVIGDVGGTICLKDSFTQACSVMLVFCGVSMASVHAETIHCLELVNLSQEASLELVP